MIFPGNLFLVQVIVVAAVICPHYIAFYYSRSLTASMSCFEKLTEVCEPSRLFERLDVSRNAYWCEEESGTLASVRRDEMQEEQKACFHLHPFKTNSEITSEQIFSCGCDGLAPELKAVKTTFKHRPVMTDDMTSSLSNRCHRIRIQNASDISSNTILKAVIVKIGGSVNMPTAFCHLSTSLRCLMHSYKALRINADITFNRLACDKKKKKLSVSSIYVKVSYIIIKQHDPTESCGPSLTVKSKKPDSQVDVVCRLLTQLNLRPAPCLSHTAAGSISEYMNRRFIHLWQWTHGSADKCAIFRA